MYIVPNYFLRSLALSFLALAAALEAFVAISERSSGVRALALAFPPRLPISFMARLSSSLSMDRSLHLSTKGGKNYLRFDHFSLDIVSP